MSAGSEGIQAPVRHIHEAQRECLEARELYEQAKQEGADVREAAHRELHRALKAYYEAMFPLLDKRSVEEFWEGSEDHHLWSERHQVLRFREYLEAFDEETLDTYGVSIAECPEYAYPDQLPEWILAEDIASNYIEYDIEYIGLRGLEFDYEDLTVRTERYTDATGTHERTVEEFHPMDAEILQEAARLLDMAAQRLGILADVEDDAPRTEVTMETVEEFRENMKEVLGEIDEGKYGEGIEDLPGVND